MDKILNSLQHTINLLESYEKSDKKTTSDKQFELVKDKILKTQQKLEIKLINYMKTGNDKLVCNIQLNSNIWNNISKYYNPVKNGTAILLNKISKEAQLKKPKYIEIINIIDNQICEIAKKGYTQLKWNWDEFRKECNISMKTLIKPHENSCAEFDHIDFENICIHYLNKGYTVCTNCAKSAPYINDNKLYKVVFHTHFDKKIYSKYGGETKQRNKFLIGPKFYKEWHISIGSQCDTQLYQHSPNYRSHIPDEYIAIWIKWDKEEFAKKSITLDNNIIKINDNIEYSMGYYS